MPGLSDPVVEAARVDDRPRVRRLLMPIGATLGVAAVAGLIFAVDPNRPGIYPTCPTQFLFGIDCPACGALRGTHALLHGNAADALDHNILLPFAIVVMVVLAFRWFRRAWSGRVDAVTHLQFQRRNTVLVITLALLIAFGIVRNFVPYLSSGA